MGAAGVGLQLQRTKTAKAPAPLLSAYMGHAHVSYTKHYLHLTATLRKLASERFAELALPELDPVP